MEPEEEREQLIEEIRLTEARLEKLRTWAITCQGCQVENPSGQAD